MITNRREFLMLANKTDQMIPGWYYSTKLDGMRCFFDGGVSRGLLASQVPWSNTVKDKYDVICSGLWSRLGKVIYAPDWWLDELPRGIILDGELYNNELDWGSIMSITKKHIPDKKDWESIQFHVFDAPTPTQFCCPGLIKNPHYSLIIDKSALHFVRERHKKLMGNYVVFYNEMDFGAIYNLMATRLDNHKVIKVIEQTRFIGTQDDGKKILDTVFKAGGEGIMMRAPYSKWEPKRSRNLLKLKISQDAEGIVVGYTTGLGKYEGMIGALIIEMDNGKRFFLSGMTDAERYNSGDSNYIISLIFPIGTKITYTYRELSPDGMPKEARYKRKFQE